MEGRTTRIAHVTDIASVGSTLVDELRALGVDADLIDPPRPGRTLRYPWKAAVLPLRGAGLLRAVRRIRAGRYDLVHLHYARLGLLGPMAGLPYVVHCHGSDVRGVSPRSAWGSVVGPALRRAKRVLYATPDLAPWVAAFRPDAQFMPNPIQLHEVQPPAERRDLLVGVRLDPAKGSAAIRRVVASISELRPATTMTIVNLGIDAPAVRAAGGAQARLIAPVDHAAMPELLAAHRVALGQTALGVVGNYELEALSAALPTAASFRYPRAYPTPPPFIDEGSPDATAARLAALLDDEAERQRVGQAGREWVARHHDATRVAHLVADLYSEVLAGAVSRP